MKLLKYLTLSLIKRLIAIFFCLIPLLSSAEVIKLNCVMLHDKTENHSYTVDTQKKVVVTNAGPPVDANITESVISFTHYSNDSGAIWSHLIHRQNGAMTIMDTKNPKNVVLKLQCDRVIQNKF